MRIQDPRIYLALLIFSMAAVLLHLEIHALSPGTLSSVHARVEALAGREGCILCHVATGEQPWEGCLQCHQPVRNQLRQVRGFHGALAPNVRNDCGSCHLEHLGDRYELCGAGAFAQSGIEDRNQYDHRGLGFDLTGHHDSLECSACHPNADNLGNLPTGSGRFTGLVQDCAACHKDPHEGRMARKCTACHGQNVAFHALENFEHTRDFPLDGAHSRRDCQTCHRPDSTHAVEAVAGKGAAPEGRTCLSCHMSPHRAPFVAGIAGRTGGTAGQTCQRCHSGAHASFGGRDATMDPQWHGATTFPLEGPHAGLACASCHKPVEDPVPFVERYPGREAQDCRACHGDPHGGALDRGAFAGLSCVECHSAHSFQGATVDRARHDATGFALRNAHAAAACESCHKEPPPAAGVPRSFEGLSPACVSCHPSVHGWGLKEPVANQCETCHTTAHFSEIRSGSFDHGEHTGFGLRGAHKKASCEVCHKPHSDRDTTGRRMRHVTDGARDWTRCVTCHADPHAGAFDRPGRPHEFRGATDCARCHTEETFRDSSLQKTFDHTRWTGFDLEGVHQLAACAACHVPSRTTRPAPQKRVIPPPAAGRNCEACHADPHAGQFATGGATDCAQCHSPEAGFRATRFQHDRDTRFPLDSRHQRLACQACHTPAPTHDDKPVVRYRPLGTACADCHAPPMKK